MSMQVKTPSYQQTMAKLAAEAHAIVWSGYLREVMLRVKAKLLTDGQLPRAVSRYLTEKGIQQFDFYFQHGLEKVGPSDSQEGNISSVLVDYNLLRFRLQEEMKLIQVPVAEIGFYELMACVSHQYYRRSEGDVVELLAQHQLNGHLRVLQQHCERFRFLDEAEVIRALGQCLATYVECQDLQRRRGFSQSDSPAWQDWLGLMDRLRK